MNWGAIKTLAAGYMHRKDMAPRFDVVQTLVMADLSKALDVMENETAAAFTMTASPVLVGLFESPLPDDFARPKSFQVGNNAPLSLATLVNMQSNTRTTEYAIVGRKVFTRSAADMVGVYGQRVLPVANDAGENVFMQFHPTAVIYSLLVHACNSIQDFDAVGPYQSKLDEAITLANQDKAWVALGGNVQAGYANP